MTGEITAQNGGTPQEASTPREQLRFDTPVVDDGPALYRITRDSGVLDVNSAYAYLLWCRDFAQTSVVARAGAEVVGFVTGFIRPDAPDTVVVWQVAVDSSQRGRGVASKLLAHLLDRLIPRGVRYLETTITADNDASIKLFTAAARDRGTEIVSSDLFRAELFPDAHLGEDLYRVGPFAEAAARP